MLIGQLIGLSRSETGELEGPSLPRGAIRLDTSIGSFDSGSLIQVESKIERDQAHLVWMTPDHALRIESQWACADSGIWRRRDVVINTSKKPVTITRALARFLLAPGQYEVYSQTSRWCQENQGGWQPLQAGVVLRSEGGQTCRGANPFICLRQTQQKTGMAFHLLPCGNWTITASTHTARLGPLPFVIVELGLADDHLRLALAGGQSFQLPDILFSHVANGDPSLGAPALHRYALTQVLPRPRRDAPVVYNTWFDVNEWFTVERLRRQLGVARQIGCEVFVVDAGWFGAGAGGWSDQVGDWREKLDGAFRGHMASFANEVRAAGLGFGLWVEPERLGATVPAVRQHPEWFASTDGVYFYPKLENPQVYEYILGEMARLIETYRLVWLKVDFNFERGADATGAEYYSYYREWYRLLDELRAAHPGVLIEGCSSGGLRLDLATLSHFDAHWLSDDVTALDVLRIFQGALLRIPPGRITKWAVLSGPKEAAGGLSLLGKPAVIAPVGATWERSAPAEVDFVARVALPGLFGVSGDLSSLPKAAQDRLAYHIAFFKKWRNLIAASRAHLLTPPRPISDCSGWAAIQLQHSLETTSLLFAYRLDDPAAKMRFRLRALDETRLYTVIVDDKSIASATGKQLMDDGILMEIPTRNGAQVAAITPAQTA